MATTTTEQELPFSVASIVEDFLHQHVSRSNSLEFSAPKPDEASLRRYEAAGWLRKTVGVVLGKDLPAEPSEEEFMIGLKSGIVLCTVINKINPGAVPKVVEGASDSTITPEGAALSAFQHFENIRNFLVAADEMGLPNFEASDLEQGGKSARVVNCVLAMKSYSIWKQGGMSGSWKFGPSTKPPSFGRPFMRKNSDPVVANSILRTFSLGERSFESFSSNQSFNGDLVNDHLNETGSLRSLNVLVREVLSDKRQEEIPLVIESMLGKVVEEFERRLACQNELNKAVRKDTALCVTEKTVSEDREIESQSGTRTETNVHVQTLIDAESSKDQFLRQHMLVEQQHRDIQDLKHILNDTKSGIKFLQMKYQEEFDILGKHVHSLAHAASGYRRVLEENRKLYNQLQDLKGNIRVYCRVRPFIDGQTNRSSSVESLDDESITITAPAKYCKEGRKSFTFNKIFGPCSTQEEVFSDTRPLIRSVLDGYNVCIFAYGQTGSGKTHTMSGPKDLTEENQGVNYRALNDLFLLSDQRKDTFVYEISVQMLEIYNEQVRDLLATDTCSNKKLEIRNSSQNGINVPEANLVPVSSTSDVLHLMNLGQKNRAVGATAMNDRSSRSHSCLTVHVQGKDLTCGSVLHGSMHLVDLAGSERVDKSEVTGDRLKEAQHINKSLSALGDVIAALAQKNVHVPYRNSKLTQLLQDSLGGQAKTLMFVHISPEIDATGETISTLKFAERVSTVELGAAKVNKDTGDVKELKDQISSLKSALMRKEGDKDQLRSSRSSSPERFKMKSAGSSPSHPTGRKGVGNLQNTAMSKMKRRSLDPRDIVLLQSSSWRSAETAPLDHNHGKEDDKDSISSEWDDKIMVNKHDSLSRSDESLVECWGSQLSHMFGQSYLPEKQRLGSANNDDSDDHLEVATSDSSEPDSLSPLNNNASKTNQVLSGSGAAQIRKFQHHHHHPKPARSPETRSMIPSLIPSASIQRKTTPANGVSQLIQPSYRPVMMRQAIHNQVKKKNTK